MGACRSMHEQFQPVQPLRSLNQSKAVCVATAERTNEWMERGRARGERERGVRLQHGVRVFCAWGVR